MLQAVFNSVVVSISPSTLNSLRAEAMFIIPSIQQTDLSVHVCQALLGTVIKMNEQRPTWPPTLFPGT